MRILLFGEFSGLFSCLKEGLSSLGHEVYLVSDGNGYKNFPADFRYDAGLFNDTGRFKAPLCAANLFLHRHKLVGYDIVFFIDPSVLSRHPFLNAPIYRYIIKHNKKSFLCGAGDTAIFTDYWYSSKEKYRNYILGMMARSKSKNHITLQGNSSIRKWEEELLNTVDGYIPIWYEYAQPFRKFASLKQSIRIPIPCYKYNYHPNIVKGKIVFFHGISTRPEAKGTPLIQEAFKIMGKKYGDVAEFVCAKGLPFKEYIELLNHVNVVVDNTNGYSVAMNGLFSMAQGRIVMGGAEQEGNRELGIEGVNPVINLKPDVNQICAQIEYVIKNKDKIEEWGAAARSFVEKYHDHVMIARLYEKEFLQCLTAYERVRD